MADVVLEARGLRRFFGEGAARVEVLRGVELQLKAGELLVVLGPSGSGKSTLLNLLGLMDRPSSGEVVIGGQPAASLSEGARAQLRNGKLGFVFQFDSLLPEFSLIENVALPGLISGRRGAPARARELLAGFGLSALAERLPHELSGGERQRGAIARALVNDPQVLLADEPTGNLDRHNGELVFNTLRTVAEERKVAVILVTHNEEAVAYGSRVLRLVDGAWQRNPAATPQERIP